MFKQLSEDILYKRKCEFLKKAKEIHNGKYSYDNFVFKNKTTKSIITCPIHGDFEQTPKNHLKGQGCPICGKELARNMHKHNYLHFIQKSKERFGDKYDFPYIETEYELCKEHGITILYINELNKNDIKNIIKAS